MKFYPILVSKYKNITAIILAGGENKRYNGFNKAFIIVKNKRIINRITDVLEELFSNIVIIANNPSDNKNDVIYWGVSSDKKIGINSAKVVNNIVKNSGPLGGIYTALKTTDTEMIFVVACDMPFISKDLIIKVVEIARENDWTTTIPYSKKGIEPLFGLYNKNILGHIEDALKNGHLSINKVLKKSQVKLVELSIDELNFLININTPSDLIKTEMALVSTL